MNKDNQFSQDIKDIGCVKEHSTFLKELVEKNFFDSEMSASKFAVAIAIKDKHCSPSKTSKNRITKFASNSFDSDKMLSNIIKLIYKKSDMVNFPFRIIENLLAQGLDILQKEFEDNEEFSLDDYL